MLAHSLEVDLLGTSFASRDYFRGALARGSAGNPRAYVSRVYESRAQGTFNFGITCAVHGGDPRGRPAGVLLASVTTDRTMGLPQTVDSRYVPVLVAPRESPSREPPTDYVILFHPAYDRGSHPVVFPAERAARFASQPLAADYHDPLGDHDPAYSGPWLAGSAPVSETPFLVVVQARSP
jgi:hypothetical protein